MGDELRGVGRTAVWVAMMRAQESARPDRLFDDRLASAFAAAAGVGTGVGGDVAGAPPGASEFLAVRVRFYDDFLLDACAAGIRQVVLLAAGLDSRAFRLGWPAGVALYEVDLPELFAFKESVVAGFEEPPGCKRVPVPADLREAWPDPLTAAGFDPAEPTAWVVEGVLIYLPVADNDRLLAAVGDLSAPGSRLALDHMNHTGDDRAAVRETSAQVRKMGAAFQSAMDDPVGWLAGHGWHATVDRVPAMAVAYGRPLPE